MDLNKGAVRQMMLTYFLDQLKGQFGLTDHAAMVARVQNLKEKLQKTPIEDEEYRVLLQYFTTKLSD